MFAQKWAPKRRNQHKVGRAQNAQKLARGPRMQAHKMGPWGTMGGAVRRAFPASGALPRRRPRKVEAPTPQSKKQPTAIQYGSVLKRRNRTDPHPGAAVRIRTAAVIDIIDGESNTKQWGDTNAVAQTARR